MPDTKVVREHEELKGLREEELSDLKEFALEHQRDDFGNYRPVLQVRNGRLYAGNYVGIIETRKGTVLEILPKVDLAESAENEKTKRVFSICCARGVDSNHRLYSTRAVSTP